jgi:4a-hydroxytetrahydrobiopterin dehydratase
MKTVSVSTASERQPEHGPGACAPSHAHNCLRGEPMSKRVKLSESELLQELSKLPSWKVKDGKLHREYAFADFVAAFGFMTSAALVAQSMDHHPEWFNVWNRVNIDLMTHDASGITQMDVKLAQSMEELARRQPMK